MRTVLEVKIRTLLHLEQKTTRCPYPSKYKWLAGIGVLPILETSDFIVSQVVSQIIPTDRGVDQIHVTQISVAGIPITTCSAIKDNYLVLQNEGGELVRYLAIEAADMWPAGGMDV